MTRLTNAEILARFDVAIAQLGLRASDPGRTITSTEDGRADRLIERIKADQEFDRIGSDADGRYAADRYYDRSDT